MCRVIKDSVTGALFDEHWPRYIGWMVDMAAGVAEVLDTQATGRHVSVEGHTDSIGSEAFNQQLSERRAETAAGALKGAGVNPQQITAKGFGKRYPVAPNTNPDGTDNPAGRAKNRRVEVVIEN